MKLYQNNDNRMGLSAGKIRGCQHGLELGETGSSVNPRESGRIQQKGSPWRKVLSPTARRRGIANRPPSDI